MDGVDGIRRRRSLKERLGLKNMGWSGSTWGLRASTINLSNSEDEEQTQQSLQQEEQQEPSQEQETNAGPDRSENISGPSCVGRVPLNSGGLNLAAALAAERHFRAADGTSVASPTAGETNNNNNDNNVGPAGTAPGTPLRVSLMKLLAETDGCDGEEKAGGVGNDSMCCVCMGRKKGAAFIPCGHTFCRVCSREMWLNRGSCPLCNRSILEILDIF